MAPGVLVVFYALSLVISKQDQYLQHRPIRGNQQTISTQQKG